MMKIFYFTLSFFILIFSFCISAPFARAGATVKSTASPSLTTGLVGYWLVEVDGVEGKSL